MSIWNILGIAPTTDKKIIKKAYAAKTKEIHPEERPEEFKRLHEAYQAALGYAAFVPAGNLPENSAEIEEIGQDDEGAAEGNEELLTFFEDNQERQQKRVDAFMESWEEYMRAYTNPEEEARWKDYLASETFREIRYHPQVLHLLAEEMGHESHYVTDALKKLLWDAYGFQEEEESVYHGEMQQLWKFLNPTGIRQRKREKILRSLRGPAIIVLLLFGGWGACLSGGELFVSPIVVAVLFYYVVRYLGNLRE